MWFSTKIVCLPLKDSHRVSILGPKWVQINQNMDVFFIFFHFFSLFFTFFKFIFYFLTRYKKKWKKRSTKIIIKPHTRIWHFGEGQSSRGILKVFPKSPKKGVEIPSIDSSHFWKILDFSKRFAKPFFWVCMVEWTVGFWTHFG